MKSRPDLIMIAAIIMLVAVASGTVYGNLQNIERGSGPERLAPARTPGGAAAEDTVRIGVVSRFAPNLIYEGYQPVIDYLNAAGSYHYELRVSSDYRDAVERLRRGDVTASFLGAWILRRDGQETGLVPLIAPRNSTGHSRFHDVLIVPRDSAIRSVADLAGRRVAVPSRHSWAGNWLDSEALPAVGMTVGDLDTLRHFAHHETVVWKVLHGSYDAGVVKQSVAERYLSEGLRVAAVSGPIPAPPLVARADDSGATVAEIRRLLLDLDPGKAEHARILAGWTPEFAWGFAPVDWQAYESPADGRP